MAKPSIFSKNYEQAMKKRKKKRIIAAIWVVAIVSLIICFTLWGNIKGKNIHSIVTKVSNKFFNKAHKHSVNTDIKDKKSEIQNKSTKKVYKNDNKYLNLSVNENLNIKITYDEKDGVKLYKDVININNDNKKIYYDINPSKKSLLIYDDLTQKIFLIDNTVSIYDISKEKFTSSKGYTYLRERKIQSNQEYVWCKMPKFLDDNNIAFVSQLPWLSNKNYEFIWYGNVQQKKYTYIKNIRGNSIELQNLDEKGLIANIDNNIYYITSEGKIIKQ